MKVTQGNKALRRLALGGTSLEEDDIAILDNVVLALGHHLALCLHLGFIAKLLQRGEVVHDGLNEGLLEIGMDDTGGLGRLGAVADGPLPNLVVTNGEEAAEVHGLAHLDDDLGQSGLNTKLLALLLGLLLGLEAGEPLLEGNGKRDDGVASGVLLDPLGNLGQMLVLFPDVVLLGKVDKVNYGLGGQEEEGVDDLDL